MIIIIIKSLSGRHREGGGWVGGLQEATYRANSACHVCLRVEFAMDAH